MRAAYNSMVSSVEIARLSTGVSLPYVEEGGQSGVPLLLIHAWGESRGSFSRLLPLLPRTVHAFAMDQRGHGDADKPADGYAMADFVADLVAFQDALRLGPCILVGSSSGGYVAQRFAVDEPSRTLGLVLVGTPRSLRGRPPFADEVDRLTDPIDRDWVRSSLGWFEFHHPVPAEYMADRIDDGVRMPAHVWKLALAGFSEAAVPTETGTIQAPTLIIWGDRDNLLSHDEPAKLAAAIPRSRLVTYESTGHLVLWEQPERIANDIAEFVDQVIRGGPPNG
jgi:pimeloyl-ACP methyl ester carboxylesterase